MSLQGLPSLRCWLLAATLLVGCGASPRDELAGHRVENVNGAASQLTALPQVALDDPLTAVELQALVQIAEQLPGGDLPQYESQTAEQSLYSSLAEWVAEERLRFRQGLDPQWQAEQWRQDTAISRELDRLDVDPEQLAVSMLRVSRAWTSHLLRQQQHVAEGDPATHPGTMALSSATSAQQRLERLELQLAHQLQFTNRLFSRAHTQWQREQQLEALRETLACVELARMCASMPEQHLAVVEQQHELLRPLFPTSSSVAEFEQRTESQATILRVSAEVPAR
ncbi:MAG: hypothetical protein KDB01_00255 [Planctomycetaceae bacterium]|nr:hypothetical protein [Planctomycetaceae bacterium]